MKPAFVFEISKSKSSLIQTECVDHVSNEGQGADLHDIGQ
jgi:hypothetical protein